ncbi:MAG: patatin-like phospholipase family protein [Acidobacteriota bacterium]|nr:patatin-like phospholipase family protein [Acidobacteriota bacterium]
MTILPNNPFPNPRTPWFGPWAREPGVLVAVLLGVVVLGAVALSPPAFACEAPGTEGEDRPRIGLALSGGGARGVAHVGVLQVLEEMGVPIDCVAGTSMGAVVGGFYAAGYSPQQIEEELRAIDWRGILRGQPPRRSLSFRRKEEDSRYPVGLEAGFKDGRFTIPGSALSAFALEFLLQRLTLPIPAVDHFDQYPTPFRAVAADLGTGESVVLADGDLALALRASMSIAGIYPPVEIGGRRLVDGGVVNNLPVDVVREMGADVVIAVDVGAPLSPSEELSSMAAISSQALGLAARRNALEQRQQADVVLIPGLSGVDSLDFSDLATLIEAGKTAARAEAGALDSLARDHPPRPPLDLEQSIGHEPLAAIRIEGTQRVDPRRIRTRLRTEEGTPLDLDILSKDLARVFEIGEFESVRFDIESTEAGPELMLRVVEKPWGPYYLRVGAALYDDLEGTSSYGVLVNYTRTSINARGAEWRNDFRVGETRRLRSEFYQPLDFQGRIFLAASLENLRTQSDLYSGSEKVAEYEVEAGTVGLDAGTQFGKYGELRVGLRWGEGEAAPTVGPSELPEVDVTLAGLRARLVIDRLDNVNVPRSGRYGQLILYRSEENLGADDTYTKLFGSYSRFFSRGRHTIFSIFRAGTSLDTEIPAYDEFIAGGPLSFSGFRPGELRGDHFGLVSPGYFYRLMDLPPTLGAGIYVGGWLEAGNVWSTRDDISADDLVYTATVTLAIDSRLGPVYLGYGYADRGTGYFQLAIGSRF